MVLVSALDVVVDTIVCFGTITTPAASLRCHDPNSLSPS